MESLTDNFSFMLRIWPKGTGVGDSKSRLEKFKIVLFDYGRQTIRVA